MDCIFCKIINKELPSKILYEDDLVIVILDAFPTCDGHSLIIPKVHYEDFLEIPDDLLIHIHNVGKEVGIKLMKKLNAKSLTTLVNYGERQVVKHYHYHLLPDYDNRDNLKSIDEIYEIIEKQD